MIKKMAGLGIMAAVLLAGGVAFGQSTWTGTGADANWSTVDNWDGGALPELPAVLTFDGEQRLSNNNDWVASSTVSGLAFAATAGNFTLAGSALTVAAASTFTVGGGQHTIALDLILANSNNTFGTSGNYFDVAAGATLTINGNISGGLTSSDGIGYNGRTYQRAIRKIGDGDLILTGSNDFNGTVSVSGGRLVIGSDHALGNNISTGGHAYKLVLSSGTLELNGHDLVLNGLHNYVNDKTSEVQPPDALGATLITNSDENNMVTLTFGGGANVWGLANTGDNNSATVLSGNLRVVFSNTGAIVRISGNNTFTGGAVLNNYNTTSSPYTATDTDVPLQATSATAFGNGDLVFNNGVAWLQHAALLTDKNVTVSGTNKIKAQGVNLTVSGTWTGDGLMVFQNGFQPTHDFQADMTGFTGTLIFGAQGNHTVKLGGANADLSAATFQAANNATTYTGATTVSANATLVKFGDLNSWFGDETNGSAAASPLANPSQNRIILNTSLSGGATFEVGHLGKGSIFGGTIVDGSGQVSLTKVGAGTWTLTGDNTYTGATTVSGGVLLLSGTGSINGSSGVAVSGGELAVNSAVALTPEVEVNAGGALSGTGAIGGAVRFNAAGAAVTGGDFGTTGTLTFSEAQAWGDFTYAWDILDTVAYDTLNFTGAGGLEFTGDAYTLTVNNPHAVTVENLVIISGLTDGFVAENWTVTGGYELLFSEGGLVLNAIPEPSALTLLVVGVGILALLRRKKIVAA
ncbi:MAG: autotransporter-associated beta strand repeat-containing protein [Verrucomicrobiales bacterium]|nr:autotransporter-associated beta strand repeat-containing protein [Verrucomicrobiales bacterium]